MEKKVYQENKCLQSKEAIDYIRTSLICIEDYKEYEKYDKILKKLKKK